MKKNIINNKLQFWYNKYMIIVALFGQSMHYIQSFKIFSTKSAQDISLGAYFVSITAITSWLVYGILFNSRPLIYSGILGIIGVLSVITGTLLYS